jgi:hypothetical protein
MVSARWRDSIYEEIDQRSALRLENLLCFDNIPQNELCLPLIVFEHRMLKFTCSSLYTHSLRQFPDH